MLLLHYVIHAAILNLSYTLCGCVQYYVKPTTLSNKDCPMQLCYTLEAIASNHTLMSGQENVSLILLEGYHKFHGNIRFSDLKHLQIAGVSAENVKVHSYDDEIEFTNIDLVRIEKLQLSDSKLKLFVNRAILNRLHITECTMKIAGKKIEINGSHVINCWPIEFATQKNVVSSNNPVTTLSFYHSIVRMTPWQKKISAFSVPGRGAVSMKSNCSSKLLFSECTVSELAMNIHVSRGGSIELELVQTQYYGLISITTDGSNITLNINKCKMYYRYNPINLYLYESLFNAQTNLIEIKHKITTTNNNILVSIRNTDILMDNYYRGLSVMVESLQSNKANITVIESMISDGKKALEFRKTGDHSATTFSSESFAVIMLRKVTVKGICPFGGDPVIEVENVNLLTVENSTLMNNLGTAIQAYFSNIVLSGNTLFANNSGVKGGALGLYNSYIILSERTNISFIDNYADNVGGAIYVHLFEDSLCFYLVDGKFEKEDNITATIDFWFQGNIAERGGDNIYGGTLYSPCKIFLKENNHIYLMRRSDKGPVLGVQHSFIQVASVYHSTTLVDSLFHFNTTNTLSSTTSTPKRVCLCDEQGKPQCVNRKYFHKAHLAPHYPGELFTVPAVVVGYDFGTVPGTVYSRILQNNQSAVIIQEFSNHQECTRFNFSIDSSVVNVTQTIKLTVNANAETSVISSDTRFNKDPNIIDNRLLHHPVFIDVFIEECPTGFQITDTPPHICTCHPTLVQNGIKVCFITNHKGRVYRTGTTWVSASLRGNTSKGFLIHQYCPYGYCIPNNISIDLYYSDNQCAFNHSGILCGGCHDNLSLALGTPRCLPCHNRYISLTIVFMIAGMALVFFIKVLDLTVAKGTIHGLIFYANIVWANKSILFPTTEEIHPALQILHTFIAWLNLDLGIETCFIKSLNAYWKTWLQFVFPVYVWAITGAMIIAARYSTRAGKIFGNNSVPVLATLIYLSYTKLLRTIITCFGFSLLEYPQGTQVVWSFDGNVPFFGAAHGILFVTALAVLLILWLPYTTVLLTLQWLRRKSYLKPLRWINRWKPFFDAYFGQLKPNHQYWVGLLLIVRVFLLVLFASTSAIEPRINILAIILTGVTMLVYSSASGLVYKTSCLSFLEGSFIANLTVLGILKLYVQSTNRASTIVYTSIGIVFLEFLVIVVYHIWSKIKSTYVTYKRRHPDNSEASTQRDLRVAASGPHNHMHYREPLLDSSVQEK